MLRQHPAKGFLRVRSATTASARWLDEGRYSLNKLSHTSTAAINTAVRF